MSTYQFTALLQNDQWITPAYVHLDDTGKTQSISNTPTPEISYEKIEGYALPGIPNAHSHAFQYAMAGLTERHDLGNNPDDFWGWRKAMYQLALHVNPDQIEAIATMLYAEMLRHGYTHVAEFHYVHHSKSGAPYDNLAELGERMIAAAKKVGIKITLVPIFYQKGGFGQDPTEGQKRFISKDTATYLQLFEASKKACNHYKYANIAYGVHSMRAVEPTEIQSFTKSIDPTLPFHIHVSEQLKEIEASLTYLGKRPVEWLLDNVHLNENYHLVHATHLTQAETIGLAKSKAHVVLCPSTEGNLGDGLFNLKTYQDAGGKWSIGTDSHIGLNPFEDLRILDYGQRTTTHRRNSFYAKDQGDSGAYAFQQVISSGRKAMGSDQKDFFTIGSDFDALIMDATAPLLAVCSPENLSSTILYATDVSMHLGTMVAGKWKVKNGQHFDNQLIKANFIKTMQVLANR